MIAQIANIKFFQKKFCQNYRIPGNFHVVLFSKISRILPSPEIKSHKRITMPHLLCCPRARGSFAKIFFTKLLKSPFSRKFRTQKFPSIRITLTNKTPRIMLSISFENYHYELLYSQVVILVFFGTH